jgi:hypothetical protein
VKSKKNIDGWINHGSDIHPAYDFQPPPDWNKARIEQEEKRIVEYLKASNLIHSRDDKCGWMTLARAMPDDLGDILVRELESGNAIASISMTDWPHKGSVFVCLKKRFVSDKTTLPDTVRWRNLQNPHYWDEEFSQVVDGTEHLIIC